MLMEIRISNGSSCHLTSLWSNSPQLIKLNWYRPVTRGGRSFSRPFWSMLVIWMLNWVGWKGILFPRLFPPPCSMQTLQAIKDWRWEQPGNEARVYHWGDIFVCVQCMDVWFIIYPKIYALGHCGSNSLLMWLTGDVSVWVYTAYYTDLG